MNKRIKIFGYFGHDNLGDDLLFYEVLTKLPEDWDLEVAGNSGNLNRFMSYRKFTINNLGLISRLFYRYDATIYAGGGVFPTVQYTFKQLLSSYISLYRSPKKIISGIGIVPKDEKSSKYFKLFLSLFDYISVRDAKSLNYLYSIGMHKAINCGDLFWGSDSFSKLLNASREAKRMVVCLAEPFGLKELEDENTKKRYDLFILQCVESIRYLLNQGYKVKYIPFFKETDTRLINNLSAYLKIDRSDILYEGKDFKIEEINDLFSGFDLALCMRFHSKMLSIKNNVPFIAICYDYKSLSLIEECGIKEVGVKYGIRKTEFFGEEIDLSLEDVISKIDYVLNNIEDIKEKMRTFSIEKEAQVISNYNKIIHLIERK